MPDPAKSVTDIDDVLSSIRRLVAEQPGRDMSDESDAWTMASDDMDDDMDTEPGVGSDRLVLTPALRVTDSETETPQPSGDGLTGAATDPDPAASGNPAQAESRRPTAHSDDAGLEETPHSPASEITTNGTARPAADEQHAPEMAPDGHDAPSTHTELAEAGPDLATGPAAEPVRVASGMDAGDGSSSSASDTGRAVGSGTWRAEMRLYDWQAGTIAETTDTSAGTREASRDFEPDAGDADWPDKTTNRALRELAAARSGPFSNWRNVPSAAEAGGERAAPHAEGDAPGAPDTAVASTGTPDTSGGSDAISIARTAGPFPKVGRHDDLPLNPFSAAAGSEVGGDDADDWDYDDAFAGIAGDPEEDGTIGLGGSTADPPPGDSDHAPSPPHEAPASAASGMQSAAATPSPEPGEADAAHDAAGHVLAAGTTDLVGPLDAAPSPPSDDASTAGTPHVAPPMILDTPVDAGAPDRSAAASDRSPAHREDVAADVHETAMRDTTILDEETLRRIVAEVVREELQGELGERITRNIRKLVRREIRLVLAADDLD